MKSLKLSYILAAALLVVVSSGASAEPAVFTIAASSSMGTYANGIGQLKTVCDTSDFVIDPQVVKDAGATDNLAALANNDVAAAVFHLDVIRTKAEAEQSYNEYKTLVNLFPEDIHFLALRTALEKTGGVAGFGATPVVYTTISDLKNLKVGAAGGGTVTASHISKYGDAGYVVVAYNSGDELINALKAGEIQAAVFVGAAPLKKISDLKATEFKLLSVGDAVAAKVSGWYQRSTLDYANLKNKDPIPALAVPAIIASRQFTLQSAIDLQVRFRECFEKNLPLLRDKSGMHKAWRRVNVADHGYWPWLELPAAPSTTASPQSVQPVKR